jgi:hypothetical protein
VIRRMSCSGAPTKRKVRGHHVIVLLCSSLSNEPLKENCRAPVGKKNTVGNRYNPLTFEEVILCVWYNFGETKMGW